MQKMFISRCKLSSQTHFCAPKPQGNAFYCSVACSILAPWLHWGVSHHTSEWDAQGGFLVMDMPERKSCFKTAFEVHLMTHPLHRPSSTSAYCHSLWKYDWKEAVIEARGPPSWVTHRFRVKCVLTSKELREKLAMMEVWHHCEKCFH